MSWTNDIVLEFIDLYASEPSIWDPKHPSHKNRPETNAAWNRIQESLSIECSVDELKKKKESLMSAFRGNLQKKIQNPNYNILWFAFSRMSDFLGDIYMTNYSANGIKGLDRSIERTDNEENSNEKTYLTLHPETRHTPVAKNVNQSYNSRPKKPKLSKTPSTSIKTQSSLFEQSEKEVLHSYDVVEADEIDLYAQLLAKKLKKLDEYQRDIAMNEIDNIMFRAKMKSSTISQSNLSMSPTPKKNSPIFVMSQHSQLQYENENNPFEEEHLDPESP